MKELSDALRKTPLVYITRDIERALGLPLSTEGYFIISNSTPFGKTVSERRTNVLLIESGELLDTHELMERPESIVYITKQVGHSKPNVLVFKNTPRIEEICREKNWNLLNPPAALANRVEEKISQVEWLGEVEKYLPPHEIILCKDIVWKEKSFILQFNRAHTGTGTIFVTTENILKDIQTTFPDRPARVTEYISGPVFTSNNCLNGNQTLIGNISYQITGLSPFTDNAFATIGNDWKLPQTVLTQTQKEEYERIVTAVADKLCVDGWKGLFGTDMIMDEATGKLYLLEINARQPASTTYESQLQEKRRTMNNKQLTTFEAHVLTLLDLDPQGYSLVEIQDGGQVILRNQTGKTFDTSEILQKLVRAGLTVVPYSNSAPGSDLLRIQSTVGLMKQYGEFNGVGKKIVNLVSSTKEI